MINPFKKIKELTFDVFNLELELRHAKDTVAILKTRVDCMEANDTTKDLCYKLLELVKDKDLYNMFKYEKVCDIPTTIFARICKKLNVNVTNYISSPFQHDIKLIEYVDRYKIGE